MTSKVKNQRQKPSGRQIKSQNQVIEAPKTNMIINESCIDDSDKSLLTLLKDYLIDILENSYCSLVEQAFCEIAKQSERVEEINKFHYFKLSAFMI